MTLPNVKTVVKVGGQRRKRPTVEELALKAGGVETAQIASAAQVEQLAAKPADQLTPTEKMTVGHTAIAEAREPDPTVVEGAVAAAWSVYRTLDADEQALARHGAKLDPVFEQMKWQAMQAAKGLEYLRDLVATLVSVEALLTPEERKAREDDGTGVNDQ
jgi:hypothetical protein